MERRKKRQSQQQSNEQSRRSRSPKLSVALDLVNRPNSSPPRVDGIRSLLSRKIKHFNILLICYLIFFNIRRDLLIT
jgi:hypothetical protein